jgi:hypothetical protein
MADEIIHEYRLNMTGSYLVLPILKQVLSNGTDTTLIYVVYSVIKNRFIYCNAEQGGYKATQNIHQGIWILILLVGIADTVLYSYAQVYISNHIHNAKAVSISNWYSSIHLPYVTAYCAISVEMFASAGFIWRDSRPVQTRVSSMQKYDAWANFFYF